MEYTWNPILPPSNPSSPSSHDQAAVRRDYRDALCSCLGATFRYILFLGEWALFPCIYARNHLLHYTRNLDQNPDQDPSLPPSDVTFWVGCIEGCMRCRTRGRLQRERDSEWRAQRIREAPHLNVVIWNPPARLTVTSGATSSVTLAPKDDEGREDGQSMVMTAGVAAPALATA